MVISAFNLIGNFNYQFSLISKRPISKSPLICPISASPMSGIYASLRQAKILTRLINPRNTQCIPPVKIIAFLDIEQISADFELNRFETGSIFFVFKIIVIAP